MNRAYRVALICAAAPLVLGVSIFALWLATRWPWLMGAGLFVLYGGMASFGIGAIALTRSVVSALRSRPADSRRVWRSAVLAAALLLVNFPVAGGVVYAVVAIQTAYRVVVQNQSATPLSEVEIFGGGCSTSWELIEPGGDRESTLWFSSDGSLKFRARRAEELLSVTIEGYVTNLQGGEAVVTVTQEGGLEFTRRRRDPFR